MLLQRMSHAGHEQVIHFQDASSGLRGIVAIHSTRLGPSLGGTRFYPFASEDDALTDVLRLSEGMTYKAAVAGLDHGGGKAVIVGNPNALKSRDLLLAYGDVLESLGGSDISAEDLGITQDDMDVIRTRTEHVVGISPDNGGSGDPSPWTALGVFVAMRATLEHARHESDLAGLHVAISGIGKVGYSLARRAHEAGARVSVADINRAATDRAAQDLGASVVDVEEIHRTECDIFAPCALGAVLNATTIPELGCELVVGSANNQLAAHEDGERLAARGIVYAPDYVVNAGGLINVADERLGYDEQRVTRRVLAIEQTTAELLRLADDQNIVPAAAAQLLADKRLTN